MADNSVTTFVNDVSLNSGLSVGGDASFNGNLAIAGGVNIAGSSKVTGNTQFSGFAIYDNFMISNATNQFAGSTTYTGDTTFTGKITSNDMTINGVSVFKGDATYQGNAQVNNKMNILGAADVRYDLNVSQGRVFVAKDLNVTGNSSVTGNTIVTGTSTFTDASKFLGDVSLNGNVDVSGNFTANYPIGSIPASAIAGANDLTGSVTVKGALDVSGNALISGKVGINNNAPSVSLDLSGCSDAVKLPAGTTAQCPTSTNETHHGLIRFNTETSQFEGFGAGNAWGSLGGVTDVDKNTYISAENTPGADNNELKFYTAGEERLRIDASGNVGLRSTNPQVSLDLSGCTDAVKLPAGTTAQRPTSTDSKQHGYIRFNTETSQFEGFGAGNAWGSLGGVTDVDKNTYISAENTPGVDNNELKFYTAGNERMRIMSSGDVSFNHALNLSSKLITGTTYGSASITPSLAGLASNNWTLTMNNITAVWDACASSQNSSDFAPFRVFDNSFNNTVDTSNYSQDASGNYVDASGNLVKDASGNSLDASGNVVEVNNELGWVSSAAYESVSGVYTGSNVTNVSVLGDVSGEWLELSSDISHNLTSYSFKSLDYKNFIGAHLLPKVFYIVGKTNDTNAAWVPVHKVVHLAASTDNSYNVTTPTYNVGSSTESAGTTTLIGDASAGYNITNYSTSNSYYSNYRLIVESKFNTTTDYEDVINRSVLAVGEWILASTAVNYSEVTNTTIDSSAKIGLNSSNQNQLDIIGKINLQDEIVSDVKFNKNVTIDNNANIINDATVGNNLTVNKDVSLESRVFALNGNDMKFHTDGKERMRITASGDLSLNHGLNLSSKIFTGVSYTDVTVTPSNAGLSYLSWNTTANNVTAVWDLSASSQFSNFAPYYVFDNSYNNTIDTTSYARDTSGNYVDASGNLIKDASGNSLDASGNIIQVNTELGWISDSKYNVSGNNGFYVGTEKTTVANVGDISGEWLEIKSDISYNITSYSFKALDYNNYIGVNLLPQNFYIVGKNEESDAWNPVHRVSHSGAYADVSFNASVNYTIGSTTQQSESVTVVNGSKNYVAVNYNSSDNRYKIYRLIVDKMFTSTEYSAVGLSDLSGVAIGEWLINAQAINPSSRNENYIDTTAKIALDVSNQHQLVVTGESRFNDKVIADSDVSMNSALTVEGEVRMKSGLQVEKDASFNAGVFINNDLTVNGDLNVKRVNNEYIVNTTTTDYSVIIAEDLSVNGCIIATDDVSFNKNAFVANNMSVGNDLVVDNDLTVNGELKVKYLNNQYVINTTVQEQQVIVTNDLSLSGEMHVSGDASFNSNVYVGGTLGVGIHEPAVAVDISFSDAMRIPHGTTAERPTVTDEATNGGYIRYNMTTHQFVGYGPGNSWGSLGGVINVAQNTKIAASYPNADSSNNELIFYTAPAGSTVSSDAVERMVIRDMGDVSMNFGLSVAGDVSMNNGLYVDGPVNMRDKLKVNSDIIVSTNLIPDVDNVYTLGSISKRFAQINATSTVISTDTMHFSSGGEIVGSLSFNTSDYILDLSANGKTGSSALLYNNKLSVGHTNNSTPSYTLDVAGNANVTGATSLSDTLTVAGATTLNDNVSVADAKTFSVGTGAASMGGSLTVTGATTLNDNVSVADAKTFTVGTGAASMGGSLTVTGATTLSNTLTVAGATTLNDNVSVADAKTFTVGTGAASMGGSLTVAGATTLNDNVSVADAKTFTVGTGAASMGGSLTVTGATALSDTLTVTGATTLNDNVSVADAKTFTVGTG